jgi:AAHS family 4-hydroxybenzoate transporter-like MFS transporter
LCGLVQILDGYDLNTIGLAVPSLVKEWSLPPAAFTKAFVFSSIGIMVGALTAGPIADRFGRRPMLLVSVFVVGVFSLLSAWAPSLSWLVATRFLTGVGIGGAMPTTVALTADHIPERWRSTVIMFMFCGASLGGFVAGQVGGVIIPHLGWQGIFLMGGALPLVILPFLFVLPESTHLRDRRATNGDAQRNPVAGLFSPGLAATTGLLWMIFLTNLLSMYLFGYWLPTVLTLQGLSPAQAATSASYHGAGGTIWPLVLAFFLARFRAEWVLASNIVVGVIAVVGIVFGHAEGLTLDALIFCAGAGFVGSQQGLNGFTGAAYPKEYRSTGIGWALGIGRLGGILGPVLGGILLGLGFPPSTILLSVSVAGLLTLVAIVTLGIVRSSLSLGEHQPSGEFTRAEGRIESITR